MKKSRSITLALVGSAWLATGCGDAHQQHHKHQFFDQEGKPVPRAQWKNADGTPNELYDENGNPVSEETINEAYSSTANSTSTSTSSSSTSGVRHYGYSSGWFWGPSYFSRGSIGGGSGSRAGGTTSGSVSRGGFGSTGHAMGGASS